MLARFSADVADADFTFLKSRNAAIGSNTIVQNGDQIGALSWAADDGTDYASFVAQIRAEIDGTPEANDMPGRLTFLTTADGAATPTEALRLTSGQQLRFSAAASWTANGSANVTISNVAPAGVGTATISKWLTVEDDSGNIFYIPAWT